MTNVGLLFVGAALFVNGISLLGGITPQGAAALNLFVGVMQVVFPTIAIVAAGNDLDAIYNYAGIYLFGFTYLYVGLNSISGADGRGLGWFALFVAAIAVVYAATSWNGDPVFTVIWLVWSLMWFMVLALGTEKLIPFTGWLLITGSHLTCTIPALLTLRRHWPTSDSWAAGALVIALALVALSTLLARVRPRIHINADTVMETTVPTTP